MGTQEHVKRGGWLVERIVGRAQSCRERADSIDIKMGASAGLEEELKEKAQ